MASRRTKLGIDDKPWSFNRVGLERAGGHKFKFSYGTIGEAMEQLSVENKDRRTEGVIQVSQVSLWVCLFFFFFFSGGWGSTENVSPNVKLLKKKNHQMTCLMKGNITVQDALRPQGPKEVGKGTFNSCSKHPRPSGVIFRIITIGAGRATQVEVCSCFGL